MGDEHVYYYFLGNPDLGLYETVISFWLVYILHNGLGHRTSNQRKMAIFHDLSSTCTHEVQDGHRAQCSAKQKDTEDTSSPSKLEGLEHLWEVKRTQLQES